MGDMGEGVGEGVGRERDKHEDWNLVSLWQGGVFIDKFSSVHSASVNRFEPNSD